MNDFEVWPVLAGTAAFFAIGVVWYGALFGTIWRRASGLSDAALARGPIAVLAGLGFAFEMLIAMVLWHLIARTAPPPFVVMMMACGFAIGVMAPAVGVTYLLQRRSFVLFAIDAGYFLTGMAAMGATFLLFM